MQEKALVLLVDDVPQNIQVLGNILKNQGYSFALTTSGAETTKLLNKAQPDIILLDIMLPDEDGFSICKRIKANPTLKDIPIIFLSAKHDINDKIKAFELGAVDYITKPFEDIEVIVRVQNHLQAKIGRDKINQYNRELEEIVEQRTQELIKKERESMLAQFMQGIIHNVRGPISGVANGINVISMMTDDIAVILHDPKYSDIISEIQELNKLNQDKLEALLSDLNSMLRKSTNDFSEELEVIDLNSIIQQEIDFLQVDLEFKNRVEKEIKMYPQDLMIQVIPADISQIFQNLMKNSMDAMFDQSHKKMKIETGLDGNMAYFEIADNGPGIPKEITSRIFDPYFTTKAKASKQKGNEPTGTGIGLRFCKTTAEFYGGNIQLLKSTKGARFKVCIPILEEV
jgi:signal transduction histidine kinase